MIASRVSCGVVEIQLSFAILPLSCPRQTGPGSRRGRSEQDESCSRSSEPECRAARRARQVQTTESQPDSEHQSAKSAIAPPLTEKIIDCIGAFHAQRVCDRSYPIVGRGRSPSLRVDSWFLPPGWVTWSALFEFL